MPSVVQYSSHVDYGIFQKIEKTVSSTFGFVLKAVFSYKCSHVVPGIKEVLRYFGFAIFDRGEGKVLFEHTVEIGV